MTDKLLMYLFGVTLTTLVGSIAWFNSRQVDNFDGLRDKVTSISNNQIKQYSEQQGYQQLISSELNHIKVDVNSIKSEQKTYSAEVKKIANTQQVMCATMDKYWSESNCSK